MILHQFRNSPFCGKVRAALAYKGIEYELRNYAGLRVRQVLKLSPSGKVPVLEHEGQLHVESSDIVAYLDAKFPERPLQPESACDQAQAQLIAEWADTALPWIGAYFYTQDRAAVRRYAQEICEGRPNWEAAVFSFVVARKYRGRLAASGRHVWPTSRVMTELERHLKTLSGLLDGRDWLVGDHQTHADLAVASGLQYVLHHHAEPGKVILDNSVVADWLRRVSPFVDAGDNLTTAW